MTGVAWFLLGLFLGSLGGALTVALFAAQGAIERADRIREWEQR